MRMAEIYRRMGKFDLAMENLKKAETMVQDSLEIPYNEALILEAQGKYEEAAAVLQKLVSASDCRRDARRASKNNRALFLERLGNVYREGGRRSWPWRRSARWSIWAEMKRPAATRT